MSLENERFLRSLNQGVKGFTGPRYPLLPTYPVVDPVLFGMAERSFQDMMDDMRKKREEDAKRDRELREFTNSYTYLRNEKRNKVSCEFCKHNPTCDRCSECNYEARL